MLAGMLVLTMLSAAIPFFLWLSSGLAWVCGIILWSRLRINLKFQVVCLLILGITGIVWGLTKGVSADWFRVFGQNQLIISLLVAVTLLRLIRHDKQIENSSVIFGMPAFIRNMIGLQAFSAVINISAMVIMADRLSRQQPLKFFEAVSMSRSFTMAVFYSPFIGGMALALSYTPGSSLPTIILVGLSLSALGLVTLFLAGGIFSNPSIMESRGYPIKWESLWLPSLLAIVVIVVHQFIPQISILMLVIILTPIVSCVVLLIDRGPIQCSKRVRYFCINHLPELSGEVSLFLSAGVFAAGLFMVFSALNYEFFEVFDAAAASKILVASVLLSCLGIHPIVVVSTIVPLLVSLAPPPNLMAFLCVCCWGIGCAVCPLSGTNITLKTRYNIDNWRIGIKNIPYAALMTLYAVGLFFICEPLLTY